MNGQEEHRESKGHVVGYGIFFAVWAGLLALTATTVYVSELHLGNLSTLAAMLIATAKSLLVLFFFMHLKYEPRVFKVMFVLAVATLTVIILLTFTDVWFRQGLQ